MKGKEKKRDELSCFPESSSTRITEFGTSSPTTTLPATIYVPFNGTSPNNNTQPEERISNVKYLRNLEISLLRMAYKKDDGSTAGVV